MDLINSKVDDDDPFDGTEQTPEEAKRGFYTLKTERDPEFEGGGTDGSMNLIDLQQYPNYNGQPNN